MTGKSKSWLGHETVEMTYAYLHADLKLKEAALAKTTPTAATPDRYRPDEEVLAFLGSMILPSGSPISPGPRPSYASKPE